MYYGFNQAIWSAYNITFPKFNSRHLFFTLIYFLSKLHQIMQFFSRQFLYHSFLFLHIFLEFAFVLLLITPYSSLAITANTSNIINGNPPYLTLDGGRSQITNTDGLLEISLSNGDKYTPSTNNSSSVNPIVLPAVDQSFADIAMLVPTNADSIALSSLIDAPYNYWGDVDGDGQGRDGITATGSLILSIVDKNNQPVSRNTVLTISNAPYKLTLSNTNAMLKTRYGVPNESHFTASNVTYYINPKILAMISFAKPDMNKSSGNFAGPATIWHPNKGFLPQSVTPSSYGLNFPTTGANNLYFDLDIGGNNQALSWATVSHGGITATMTDSTNTSVRVTLTGPAVTDPNQWYSENPRRIDRPSLPQVFELVGRDSSGNAVVKYGFELKQWFVNSGNNEKNHSSVESWCNNIGYRLPNIRDLTNGSCRENLDKEFEDGYCNGVVDATPSSPDSWFRRHIGGGLFSEWGMVEDYFGANFPGLGGGSVFTFKYWTQDIVVSTQRFFYVNTRYGSIYYDNWDYSVRGGGACVYP